jgi:hypothetical protein
MARNTEYKILLVALDSSRLFSICHLLTAQHVSEYPGTANDTEQQSVAILVGERMINTLVIALFIRHECWYCRIVNLFLYNWGQLRLRSKFGP